MNITTRQSIREEEKREIQSLVNCYIEEFNEQLVDYFQKEPKKRECEVLSYYNSFLKKQEVKTQVIAYQASNNRNISGFKKIQDQLKSPKLQEITQNEKQPIYSADFQTYHSLQGEQGQKKQNEQNCINKGANQIDRKSGPNCQQTAKTLEIVKKNIRVHNKSSPNINKFGQVKQTRYNELRDKTLVQYFYPRQKKIFRQNDNTIESVQTKFTNNSKGIDLQQSKLIKKSPTERNQNTAFWIKKKKQSSYKIKNDCGRKITFDNYDLVSCNFSMRQHPFDRAQNIKQIQKRESENKEPDQSVLQHRIKHMEQKVYKKMPFLVEMGVKFKIAKSKC